MAVTNLSLKLVIDTESRRVLCAEAGKKFVDFLFKILALPIGTFVPLLNQEMVGGLGNIYDSIQNLSTTYFEPNVKDSLLTPKVYIAGGTGVPLQLPNVIPTPMKLYGCNHCRVYMSNDNNTMCSCRCNSYYTNTELSYRGSPSANNMQYFSDGGYVEEAVIYMVMDDLAVKPLSTDSIITLLDKFDVKEIGTLEEKVVDWARMRYVIHFLLFVHDIYILLYCAYKIITE